MLFYFVAALVLSVITVWAVKYICNKKGWVAHPKADRWHNKPTALHGGVGMMLAWAPIVVFAIFELGTISTELLVITVFCVVLLIIGFLDDIYNFNAISKLLFQIAAAVAFVLVGVDIKISEWQWFNTLFTLVWVVGITNAINMIDNMDGLSAGIVFITVTFLLVYFIMDNNPENFPEMTLASIVLGVVLGFLVYNYNPASIFMGDSGSLFLGYFVSTFSIVSIPKLSYFSDSNPMITGTELLLFASTFLVIPITDMLYVSVKRTLKGKKFYHGGRDHLSHMLVQKGFTERDSVFILYSIAFVCCNLPIVLDFLRLQIHYQIIPVIIISLALVGYAHSKTELRKH